MMKYLHENGCPWEADTCVNAAKRGNFEILKYCHENGCPWTDLTASKATTNNHFEILKYCHDNGCPWDIYHSVCLGAAKRGFMEILIYAIENGCVCDDEVYFAAAKARQYEIMIFLKERGYQPVNNFCCDGCAVQYGKYRYNHVCVQHIGKYL